MAKFSLLTVLLLYLGMLYFGREAGLPAERIGRETSLWASLFGSGDAPGALTTLTNPAPSTGPAVAGATDPEPADSPAPQAEAVAALTEPAPEQPAAAPVLEAEPDRVPLVAAEPDLAPETGVEIAPEADPLVASTLAPLRTPRPPQRPERVAPVVEVEAALEDTPDPELADLADPAPEPDPLAAAVEAALAEDTPAEEGRTEETLAAPVADGEPVAALPDPVEAPEPEAEPEAELIVASAFAPDATPRPAPKPEPPVLPVVAPDPDPAPEPEPTAEPASAQPTPDPLDATDQDTPVAAAETRSQPEADPEPGPALGTPPAREAAEAAPADTVPDTASDPIVDAVAAALDSADANAETATDPGTPSLEDPTSEPAVAALDPLPTTDPDLADSPRPMPRPLQTLDPVPAVGLAGVDVAAEPTTLPETETVSTPDPASDTTETPAADPTPAAETEIATAALPEPEPAPVVPTLPDEPQGVLYVTDTGVTVRAGPSDGDRSIDEMTRGSAVVDLGGKGDGWRMILLPNGAAGYIPDRQLSLTPGE